MKTLLTWIATGFGLGYSPVASGTVGSLWGVLIVLLMPRAVPAYAITAAVLSLLAIPVCEVAERHFLKKDDGRIVADEFLTFPLCLIGLPLTPWVVAMAFVTCRLMDIIKPPPARGWQEVPGGLGIVLDDIVASLYALALNHGLYLMIRRVWFES